MTRNETKNHINFIAWQTFWRLAPNQRAIGSSERGTNTLESTGAPQSPRTTAGMYLSMTWFGHARIRRSANPLATANEA